MSIKRNEEEKEIIVSFTSYPGRIQTVEQVIRCLVNQTVHPDKIILYLSEEQFADYNDFPDFGDYEKDGFAIKWCNENLGPHKKYYYSMQEYPDAIIITVDDDILYSSRMIEELLDSYKRYPNSVIARRAHMVTWLSEDIIAPYAMWYSECGKYVDVPRMDLVATGCGGILYPPHIFSQEIFNKNIFMKKAPFADDMWLKVMELCNEIPVVLATHFFADPMLEECLKNSLYYNQNAGKGNDRQLHDLLNLYNDKESTGFFTYRLGRDGKTMCKDLKRIRKQDMEKLVAEFIRKAINQEKILIYGAGCVAKRLYYALKTNNCTEKIEAFIVKDITQNPRILESIRVESFMDYVKSSYRIIIGLWATKQNEVYEELIAAGIAEERIVKLDVSLNNALMALEEEEDVWKGSCMYWEERYMRGGNSGSGSYNRLAEFKAAIINKFVEENVVNTVVEWGCGDGNQLMLAQYSEYIGYDISQQAITICKDKFKHDRTKRFIWCGGNKFIDAGKADLAISLDVIYHLVEDEIYFDYMNKLFNSSKKYVCIYSCNYNKDYIYHVKCRKFTDYIEQNFGDWELFLLIPNKYPYDENDSENTSWSDFYFYRKKSV